MREFQPNETINNRYKVVRKLGAGAMGSVYLCEDSVENNIKVALKVLVSDDLDDQDMWAKGEYEALTRLRHPNLAKVYNFGRIGDSKEYFIVSEFIKGIDLYSSTEYLRFDELTDIIVQICRALEYIHSQGYVHFDIKPDNILVTRYKTVGIKEGSKVQYTETDLSPNQNLTLSKPNVKLIDFGLAEKITGSFNYAIKGTLNYLAPEILDGKTPDKRADLYSLGVTLFQVANRDLPFFKEFGAGGTLAPVTKNSDLFRMHMKRNLPQFLQDLILKLVEGNCEERFQSARDVIHFINKNSEYHFDLETAETRDSYFYASKLVGRRREVNLLKEYHERAFFPQRCASDGDGAPATGGEPTAIAAAAATALPDAAPGVPSPVEPAAPAADGRPDGDERPADAEKPLGPVAEAASPAEGAVADDDDDDGGTADVGEPGGPRSSKPDTVTSPSLVIVNGEMGSGKSRLLEEFQHYLKLRDFPFYSGNCYEANRKAYQPFIEILRQLVYGLGFSSELYQKHRQDILKLMPELRDKADSVDAQAPEARLDKEKLCFIDRISQLLIEAAQAKPYVLAVNNMHWVDDASLDLLDNLFMRLAEHRKESGPGKFLLVVSIRPEEPISDRLREFLERARAGGVCAEVHVRRLKFAQILEFLRSMLNFSDVPEAFVAKLVEKTGGNPLLLVETLKTLEADGVIRNAGDGWVIKATNYDRIDIPHRMEDVLEKRLQKLDPVKRQLIEVLSVLDKPANPKFVQQLKRFSETPILVELRNLEQTGLVAKIFEAGKLHFQIAQPKVRELVYTRIPEEARRRYHGEVGILFLEVYRGKEDEVLEEAAFHFMRSDQTSKSIELALKAGDRLKRIYANERAYDYYMYVLEKVEADSAYFDQWVEIHERLGDLCTIMGRYEMADRSYGALLEEEVRTRFDAERLVKTLLARGKVYEIQGDYDLALKSYKDARNCISQHGQPDRLAEKVRILNSIGWVYVCLGKYEKAMAISQEALKVVEGTPENMEHAMVYSTIGNANFFKGNFQAAIEYHRRSLQIKENLESMPEITTALNNLGAAYLAAVEYGDAADLFQRALKTSEEVGDPYGRAMCLHNLAQLYFAVGHQEKGWECLDESLKLSKHHNMRYLNTQNYMVRGKALTDQGEYTKAEGNFFRALTAFTKQANRWGLCNVLLQIARLHRLTGNLKEALSMVVESRRYAAELETCQLQAQGLTEEARIRREDGEEGVKAALKLLDEAIALADKCDHPELSGETYLEMGETQVRQRRLQDAARYYEIAEEKFREVLEALPTDFHDGYQRIIHARFRNWKGSRKKFQVPAEPRQDAVPAGGGTVAAAPAAPAAPRSRAEDSLQRVNALMVALRDCESLKDFLGRMLDDILAVLSAEAGYFLFLHEKNLTVDAARATGGCEAADPTSAICVELIESVVESRRPLLLADVADDPDIARQLEECNVSCSSLAIMAFPISPWRQGVLYLINPQLPKGGGQEHVWLVQPFLNLAPFAYQQLSPEAVSEL